MAVQTYTPIQSVTLTTNSATVILGTGGTLPQSYTDLVLITSVYNAGANTGQFQVNGDSGSNYSFTVLNGSGSSATSTRQSNKTFGVFDNWTQSMSTSNFDITITQFMNYANTTTYKTILNRTSVADKGVEVVANLWRSTSAISSITLFAAANFFANSTFTLYGIKAS